MSLTGKQEAFAAGLAAGMGQLEAYAAAGYSVRGALSTVKPKASRLAASESIKARVSELRDQLAREVCWDRLEAARVLRTTLDVSHSKVLASQDADDEGDVPADMPREATRATLQAVAALNDLFGIEASSDDDERVVVVIDV